jgi:PKD repeat protein
MADARLTFAATVAALAGLLLTAIRPVPACAQQQSQDSQDSQQQQMQAPGTMQVPGAMSGSMPESMTNGRAINHVDIPQPPLITMTAVPGYGAAPLSVGFYVSSVDPESKGFVSYVWNFGDGQVSMDPPLTFFHTYAVAGTYVATVSATTADGRTAVAYVGVTVRPSISD